MRPAIKSSTNWLKEKGLTQGQQAQWPDLEQVFAWQVSLAAEPPGVESAADEYACHIRLT